MNEQLTKLRIAGMRVIEVENLPIPIEIKFRNNHRFGNRKVNGRCIKDQVNNNYRILISLYKTRFEPDPNGNFYDKLIHQRVRIAGTDPVPIEKLRMTLAHEIAHLRFWKHDASHRSYTDHIHKSMLEEE